MIFSHSDDSNNYFGNVIHHEIAPAQARLTVQFFQIFDQKYKYNFETGVL